MSGLNILLQVISEDWRANRGNWKGRVVLIPYRLAHACLYLPTVFKPFGFIFVFLYKLVTEYIIGVEIHWKSTIGGGARVFHGYGLVVHSDVVIGRRVVLRHNTTIGLSSTDPIVNQVPTIGDDVDIGAGAILIGGIRVGDRAKIGAGAVVVKDVPELGVAVGNPARLLHRPPEEQNAPTHHEKL